MAKLTFATADLLLPSPRGPRILIYHQVGAGLGRQMEVRVEDFEWHLEWLTDNRQVVDLETAIKRWHEPHSDRLVVLTFDDGYRDTYATAFPRLMDRGIPFTLYLASDALGTEGRLSWHELDEITASGLATVGAHTHTHADLRHASEDEILTELEMSNSLIESRLGRRPEHFAYPWGYWSDTADDLVRNLYSSASLGSYHPSSQKRPFDPHMIHRFPIQLSDGTRWFPSRLRGGLLIEEEVRRRLHEYRPPPAHRRIDQK